MWVLVCVENGNAGGYMMLSGDSFIFLDFISHCSLLASMMKLLNLFIVLNHFHSLAILMPSNCGVLLRQLGAVTWLQEDKFISNLHKSDATGLYFSSTEL